MNKTLWQLAYRNIIKQKKYYIFVCLFIFGIALFYNTFTIVQKSDFRVNREYNEETYGYWYVRGEIDDPLKFDRIAQNYEKHNERFQYGYIYMQGESEEGYQMGYANEQVMNVCANHLISGQYAQNTNEIVVSQKLYEEKQYKLNQKVHLNLGINENNDYTIVGVIRNSQAYYFPDIYTGSRDNYQKVMLYSDRSLSMNGDVENYSGCQILGLRNEENLNPYGYNHNPELNAYQVAQIDLIILIESLIMMAILLITFISISLKKRSHEFALLRGIGMTTRQLKLMCLYEYVICALIAVVLGMLSSVGLSYGIMKVIEQQTHIFHWAIDITSLIVNSLIVLICLLMTLLYPVSRSSHYALSGTFDGQQFQYIQVRYRKLLYQNKWRLAWRELKTNKKIHIFLVIILTFHASIFLMNQVIEVYNQNIDEINSGKKLDIVFKEGKYFTVDITNDDEKKSIDLLQFPKTKIISYQEVPCQYDNPTYPELDSKTQGTVQLVRLDRKDSQDLSVDGKMFTNHNQAIMHNGQFRMSSESFYGLSLESQLTIQNQKIEIVGEILPSQVEYVDDHPMEFYLISVGGIYVDADFFDSVVKEPQQCVQIYYETIEQREKYIQKIYDQSEKLYSSIRDYGELIGFLSTGTVYPEKVYLDPYIVMVTLILSSFIGFVFNRYEILNKRHDYALYQLIGMTKKDLFMKQLCKGSIIFIIVEIITIFIYIIECLYLKYWVFPIQLFIGISGLILLICLGVYVLPLLKVLSNQPLENMNKVE
ncbi:ABC transporter permease [Longibaculum muris]|uniref:ABC transporter permease n=1 Tax=Longibaculum muris TaxID=1796628 RepID=UPI0012B77724|nr:ABC transporter permease [Longibaculum muris]